jgi:hypothetical protein
MAHELVTKAQNASFVRTGYVCQMNIIVTQYSVANSGLLGNSWFQIQGSIVRVTHI